MSQRNSNENPIVTISFGGDVMTGRGIDQILSHPNDPELREPYVQDAGRYVQLAMNKCGPINWPVDDRYIWGDALTIWDRTQPDLKIVNLETSITAGGDFCPDKAIHYRMNPKNIGCLNASGIDGCALANNHVLDFGRAGLLDTLRTLDAQQIKFAGAGKNSTESKTPAVFEILGGGRVLLFAFGHRSSGIPENWTATENSPGIWLLPKRLMSGIKNLQNIVSSYKRENDVVVASIHWGPNWDYHVLPEETEFARALIDTAEVDLVFGHSSHHVKRMERYHNKLILYGCGDLVTDYEGIGGHEQFRGDLGLIYLVSLECRSGEMFDLKLFPTQMRQLRLQHSTAADARVLVDIINRESHPFELDVELVNFDSTPMIRLCKD